MTILLTNVRSLLVILLVLLHRVQCIDHNENIVSVVDANDVLNDIVNVPIDPATTHVGGEEDTASELFLRKLQSSEDNSEDGVVEVNFICDLEPQALRCSQRGKVGRRMHRSTFGFYCRETCIFPQWQVLRSRFGWVCGGCDGRLTR